MLTKKERAISLSVTMLDLLKDIDKDVVTKSSEVRLVALMLCELNKMLAIELNVREEFKKINNN